MFANVGDVVQFSYKQDIVPRLVKVATVRDTEQDLVLSASKRSYHTARNRYLITGVQAGGQVRSFYTDNVQPGWRVLSRWQRVKLWLCGVRFLAKRENDGKNAVESNPSLC